MKLKAFVFMLFVVTSLPVYSFAGVGPSPFNVGSGFDNPVLWVLFAPQPEPPKILNDGSVLFTGADTPGEVFQFSFGFENTPVPFSSLDVSSSATSDGIEFFITDIITKNLLYTLDLSFSSGQAIIPGSDVMFAPQPEPPKEPYLLAFSLDFANLEDNAVIAMSLQLTDADGNPLALTSVPEPATILLFAFGLLGLAGTGRALRKE